MLYYSGPCRHSGVDLHVERGLHDGMGEQWREKGRAYEGKLPWNLSHTMLRQGLSR